MENITISQLSRKQLPSKHKEGETYDLVNIVDAQNREFASFGDWTKDWKVGDTIKGIIKPKEWVDRNGIKRTSFNITNPDAKPYNKGGFAPAPSTRQFQAYSIAATLIPVLMVGKKITLADVDKLAIAIKKRIDAAKPTPTSTPTPAPTQPVVPVVEVDNPTSTPTVHEPANDEITETDFEFDEKDPFGESETDF